MKAFFVKSLEAIITVVLILLFVAVIGATFTIMNIPAEQGGGLLPALGVLVGGTLYVLLFGGIFYLVLGIHDNTKRTAELLEEFVRAR